MANQDSFRASTDAGVVTGPVPGMPTRFGDPCEALPAEAVEKFRALQLKRDEAATLLRATIEDQQELRLDIQRQQNRIKELKVPRGEGGFGLDDSSPQVVAEKQKLDRKLADQRRLSALSDARAAVWNPAAALVRDIEQFVAAPPSGHVAKMVGGEAPTFRGSILDAVEGRRRGVRQLLADADRVRCAPHPAAARKAAMVAEVEAWAEQGKPDAASSIEHGAPISWPLARHQFDVYNAGPGAIAFGQLVDIRAFMAWWDKDGMIARLSAEIDECADDKAALTSKQRQEAEAQIRADLLAVEREEVALIEMAQQQGIPIALRPDTDIRAILAIEWVVAPPPAPRDDAGTAGIIRRVGN